MFFLWSKSIGEFQGSTQAINPNNFFASLDFPVLKTSWYSSAQVTDVDWKTYPISSAGNKLRISWGGTLSNQVGLENPFIVGTCRFRNIWLEHLPQLDWQISIRLGRWHVSTNGNRKKKVIDKPPKWETCSLRGWSDDGLRICSKHLRNIKQSCKSLI